MHYEPQPFIHLNDKAVATGGGSQLDRSSDLFFSAIDALNKPVVLKDPMFARAWPFYKAERLKNVRYVINLRHYKAVLRHMIAVRRTFGIGNSDNERVLGANRELLETYDAMLTVNQKMPFVRVVSFEALLEGNLEAWEVLETFLGRRMHKRAAAARKSKGVKDNDFHIDPSVVQKYDELNQICKSTIYTNSGAQKASRDMATEAGYHIYYWARFFYGRAIIKGRRRFIDRFADNFWIREPDVID